MSQTDENFRIQIDESTTISRHDTVEHIEHGPMYVERISVGPAHKRVQLQSELDPLGIKLTEEELREQWGETLGADPMELHKDNPRVEMSGLHLPDSDQGLEAELGVVGDDPNDVEIVAMHAKDQIVRAMQAIDEGEPPEDVDGIGVDFHWDRILGEEVDDGE